MAVCLCHCPPREGRGTTVIFRYHRKTILEIRLSLECDVLDVTELHNEMMLLSSLDLLIECKPIWLVRTHRCQAHA